MPCCLVALLPCCSYCPCCLVAQMSRTKGNFYTWHMLLGYTAISRKVVRQNVHATKCACLRASSSFNALVKSKCTQTPAPIRRRWHFLGFGWQTPGVRNACIGFGWCIKDMERSNAWVASSDLWRLDILPIVQSLQPPVPKWLSFHSCTSAKEKE